MSHSEETWAFEQCVRKIHSSFSLFSFTCENLTKEHMDQLRAWDFYVVDQGSHARVFRPYGLKVRVTTKQ